MDEVKSQVKAASGSIEETRRTVHKLVTTTGKLHSYISSRLGGNAAVESLSKDLEDALPSVLDKFHKMFPSPDQAVHHNERERAIRSLLDMIEDAIVTIGSKHGIDEAVLREHIAHMKPLILKLVLLTGLYSYDAESIL